MAGNKSRFELHLDVEQQGIKAVELLSSEIELSKQQLKQVMQKGAVWLTHGSSTRRLRRASKTLEAGDKLHCYYDENVLAQNISGAKLVADEGEYSIWYKPSGMLSQGSKWGDHTTIYRYAELNLRPERPAFIVHRLDRAATGLILLAHSKKTARLFAEMFRQRKLDKRYQVIVHGHFPVEQQTIDTPLDDKVAISHVNLLEYNPQHNTSLLQVKIDTGRKHQIRRHLSGLGYPVLGDRLYGLQGDAGNLQLTACHLAFVSPLDGKQKEYRLPEELLPQF